MCGNCFVAIPMTRHLLFLFLLRFSQMFPLAEKVMDSSMKGLCLNCLHLLFCHYDPTSGHLTLLWINLLLLKIIISSSSLYQ